MPATDHNPDYLQDHRHLRVQSQPFAGIFIFRRLAPRDRQKIDDLVWEYCGGKPERMSGLSQLIYTATATLQVALVTPTPKTERRPDGFDFADEEDAEVAIIDLHEEYRQWRDRFRRPADPGPGGSGDETEPDGRVGVPEDLESAS